MLKKADKKRRLIKTAAFIPLIITIIMAIYYFGFYSAKTVLLSPGLDQAKTGLSFFLLFIMLSFVISIVILFIFYYLLSEKM